MKQKAPLQENPKNHEFSFVLANSSWAGACPGM